MATDEPKSSTSSIEVPWPEPNGIWAKYDLHCHCGAIRYNIKISPPLYAEQTEGKEQYVAVECHCSHCARHGALMVHPLAENVEWTQGLEHRGTHRSGSKENPHFFCLKCGCFVATDLTKLMEMFGTENRMSINIRMLKDFDLSKLKIKQAYQMKDYGPKYEV